MLVLLSPSKTQDYSRDIVWKDSSKPKFSRDCLELVDELRNYNPAKIAKLMSLSKKLAELNYERYQTFSKNFTKKTARQALLAFRGDVYSGFDLQSYKAADIRFAQDHIRILSGLYGVLRPLDLIQPYRLEMKTRLPSSRGKDLYAFWGSKIAEALEAERPNFLVNLASNEYFKVVQRDLESKVITPVFKEKKGSEYKVVALFAKQARGAMANFIVKKRAKKVEDLKDFQVDGYRYHQSLSDERTLTFTRSR